jgi:anti-anti-sigma factor
MDQRPRSLDIGNHDEPVPATGAIIVRLSGELDLATAGDTRQQIAAALDDGDERCVLIDLTDVSFCDSVGFQALLTSADDQVRGRVSYANPQPIVQRLLSILDPDGRLVPLDGTTGRPSPMDGEAGTPASSMT